MLDRRLQKIWRVVYFYLYAGMVYSVFLAFFLAIGTCFTICFLLLAKYFGLTFDPKWAGLLGMFSSCAAFYGYDWLRDKRREKAERQKLT